ncbi:unnamed protein product [Sphagnum compactum]
MVTATENFVAKHPDHKGSIAFLLTSDEEGPGVDGTARVLDLLTSTGERVDYCVVGEPTSVNAVGDMIKIGRRGSLSGILKIIGVQGHVAYPERASNPIHLFAQPLVDLCGHEWDKEMNSSRPLHFRFRICTPAWARLTSFRPISRAQFNFRFSTETSVDKLKKEVSDLLESHGVKFEITWTLGGQPFLTPIAELSEATQKAIKEITIAMPKSPPLVAHQTPAFSLPLHATREDFAVAIAQENAVKYFGLADEYSTKENSKPSFSLRPTKRQRAMARVPRMDLKRFSRPVKKSSYLTMNSGRCPTRLAYRACRALR